MHTSRILAAASLAAACAVGCGGRDAAPKPVDVTKAPAAKTDEPWRYGPTLREAIGDELIHEPILEVANPDQARLHIVAAVYRPDETPPLRVEQFAFTQHNESGALKPESDPVVVLRTEAAQPTPAAWEGLRRQMAAPRAQVKRPLGLSVAGPSALLPALQALATTARDAKATPQARVKAMAELLRGVDDTLVLESHKLAATIDALAAGTWAQGTPRGVSPRRHAIDLPGEPKQSLALTKKRLGWVLSSVP